MEKRYKKALRAIKEAYTYDNTPVIMDIEAILDIVPEIDADGDEIKWVMKQALAYMKKEGVDEIEKALGIEELPEEMIEALKLFPDSPIDDDFIPNDSDAYEAVEYVEKRSGLKVDDFDIDVFSKFVSKAISQVYSMSKNGKLKTTDTINKFGIMKGKDFKKVKDDIVELVMLETTERTADFEEKHKELTDGIIEKLSKKREYLLDMEGWEKNLFVANLAHQVNRNTRSIMGGF